MIFGRNGSNNNADVNNVQLFTNNGRGKLFTQIVRVLRDCRPKAFLLENVPGLLTTPYKDGTTAWQEIERCLSDVGYDVSKEVIPFFERSHRASVATTPHVDWVGPTK